MALKVNLVSRMQTFERERERESPLYVIKARKTFRSSQVDGKRAIADD